MSSPLFTAAFRGNADTVRKLIENGNNVNFVDESGRTPLWLAARGGHSEVVRILLEHEGTVHNIRDKDDCSPMDSAVKYGRAQVLRVLLSNDAVMAEAAEDKKRLLFLAARNNQVETLKVLLDQLDAKVNTQDDQGHSLLAFSASVVNIGTVEFLLQYPNIDVNLRDTVGRCALAHAVRPGNCGAEPEIPLSSRVEAQAIVVNAIASHPDIDTNSKDDEGHTPLSLAKDSGHWALVEPILSHIKTKVGTEDDSERTISLGTVIDIMTPRTTFPFEEDRSQYTDEVFQYFLRKRNFLVDWTQEDASATLLYSLEHEILGDAILETILQQFPLNLPGHDRLLNSLVAMLLRKRRKSATEVVFRYSTLVPNLSSDEWLSRIEAGFQRTDTRHLDDYCHALWILVERDTRFPMCRNERTDNILGTILLRAASSRHSDRIF